MKVTNSRSDKTLNIAIVSQVLAPYRITLLNRLNEIPRLRLKALLSSSKWIVQGQKVGLEQARFLYQVFKSYWIELESARADRYPFAVSPTLWVHLLRARYDLIVGFGWTSPNTLLTLLIAKCRRTPVMLWETSIPHPSGRLKQFLMPLLRWLVGAYDGYFVSSTLAHKYFFSMGARADRITLLPQVIDTTMFAPAPTGDCAARSEWKAKLGITTRIVILFVGQLTKRKGLENLLEAFHRVSSQNEEVSLLLVGKGPMQAELEKRAEQLGVADRIFFGGYIAGPELPRIYTLSDVFVLPSWYDTFGVVIPEAMACGLPVVTTTSVGAAYDLVRNEVNGFVVEYGDVRALANALAQVTGDETRRAEMGKRSLEIIAEWNLDVAAENFEKAVWQVARPDERIQNDA